MKKRCLTLIMLLCAAFLPGCAQHERQTMPIAQQPATVAPDGQLSDIAIPTAYQLDFTIDPSKDRFSGYTQITIDLNNISEYVWLHGKDLDVSSSHAITAAGKKVEATYQQVLPSGVARLDFAEPVPAGKVELHLSYTAAISEQPKALFKAVRGGHAYTATQFQTISAREVFPGFDEPRFKQPFTLTITSPDTMTAIANTPVVKQVQQDNNIVHHFATTAPLPTYLVAFAVGPYDLANADRLPANTIREKSLPLRGVVAQGLKDNIRFGLTNTQPILESLERYFGSGYPYQKLDLIVPPLSLGYAMENPGAVVYDEYLMLMDSQAPLEQKRSHTLVHAHELAHMWFGNLVTPQWWDDLWLNESFATWMAYKTANQVWPEGEFERSLLSGALKIMEKDSQDNAQKIREPVQANDQIAYALSAIAYHKGAGVLNMLEKFAGEQSFRDGVQTHIRRYAHQNADAHQFMQSVSDGSNIPELVPVFTSFITQPGVPLLDVSLSCKPNQPATVTLNQSRYAPVGSEIDTRQRWTLPVCLAHDDEQTCTIIDSPTATVALEQQGCPDYVHPNASQGYYRFSMGEADWRALLSHATQLPADQALIAVDSLTAAFKAGTVSASTWLHGMEVLATHSAWDVTDLVAEQFETVSSSLLDAETMSAASQKSLALFRPVYARVKSQDTVAATLLGSDLQHHLLTFSKDPALRQPLQEQAKSLIASIDQNKEQDIDVSTRATVLRVGVSDLGTAFFNKLLTVSQTTQDPALRADAIIALASTDDPMLSKTLLGLAIDGTYKGYDAFDIIDRQISNKETREATYTWLKENVDAVFKLFPKSDRGPAFPHFGRHFCSTQKAEDWQQFVESHAASLSGYERSLAKAVEKIKQCAAMKQKLAAPLSQALTAP
ncbi:M1 family metallopeptidase [Alteromonas halophila]|uniref:Aminopeptidase n=1 Tax=Alteromonas halophila TaxID=516698 RepID=A0A918JK98_9ALTE|nr:M1 family metallopeptidase [Alteromonas halophila]GGW84648.1 aminopeptidase [Alteromonas halophila]